MVAAVAPMTAEAEPTKAQQILDGAKAVFAAAGYEGASMSEIAARAGVSKGTLYNYFPSKERLFAACIHEHKRTIAGAVFALDPDAPDLHRELTSLGLRYFELLTRPQLMSVYRSVIAESPKFPELRRIFYEAGPRFGIGRLAEFLRAVTARGRLAIADPDLAAAQFLMLCRADLYHRKLLCLIDEVDEAELRAVVASAVKLFLKGYAPAGTADAAPAV